MSDFTLAVDLDGVCADYTNEFRRVVARKRNQPPEYLPEPVTWDFSCWGIQSREQFLEWHNEAVDNGAYSCAVPIEGAQESLKRLSDGGVRIMIVTHRLITKGRHERVVTDTVRWLDQHGFPYRDLLFVEDKSTVRADLFVDDAPHNVESIRDSGQDCLVFDQPWNRDVPAPRALSWSEVEFEVATEIKARSILDQCVDDFPGVGMRSGW